MRRDAGFWSVHLARGVLTLLLGFAMLPIPDMTRTLLLLPLGYALAVLALSFYGLVDSLLLLASSACCGSRLSRTMLAGYGVLGSVVGASLYFVYYEKLRIEWFLSLAALQACSAAFGELVVAKHAAYSKLTRWNYIGAGVGFTFALVYAVLRIGYASSLSPAEMCAWVDFYLMAFGTAMVLTSSRMLYADYASARAGNDLKRQEV